MSVQVSITGSSVTEGSTGSDPFYLQWTITLSEPAQEPVTVDYRFLSGTGQAGDDAYFWNSGSSVTFAAGETSKTVFYRVDADFSAEPDETIVLEAFSAEGAVLADGAPVLRSTGWILDDDGADNKLALYVSRPLLIEGDAGAAQAVFEVSLSRPAPEPFVVDYTTLDGSAVAGEDYVATSGTLSFAQGQTVASVSVPVNGDTEIEPTEGFTLDFTAPSIVAQTSVGAAEILDDDAGRATGVPTVSIAGSSVTEGSTGSDPFYLQWTITLSEPAQEPVTVDYRFLSGTGQAGDDAYFWNSGSSVTFAAGETSKTVFYRVDADFSAEPDETIVLEAFSAEGAVLADGAPVLRSTGWILDDDGADNKLALYVSRPLLIEGDAGAAQAVFEVSLSRPAPEPFVVDYTTLDGSAVAGEDYVATSGTLSFAQGQTVASVSVPVNGDTEIEPTEGFTLDFTAPSIVAQTSVGAAEILDDDAGRATGVPTVSIAGSSVTEGSTGSDPFYLQWTITLSEPAQEPVTVDYRFLSGTGQAGDDAYFWNSGSSVTFAAGETSKTVFYRVDADFSAEPDETIVLEAFSAEGAVLADGAPVLRSTGWILDDDGADNKLALYVSRPLLIEGDAGAAQAVFEVSLSRPAPEPFVVDYTTLDGSAVAGEDYVATSGTLSFAQGQTVASVSVPVNGDTEIEPTEGFTLDFTAPSIVAQTSVGAAEILDDDAGRATGVPTVSIAGSSVTEGSTGSDPFYLQWTITLSEPAQEPVTVDYRFLSGSGQAGDDAYFWNSGSSVTFAAGETSKTVFYRVDADFSAEPDETIVLEAFSAEGAVLADGAPVLRSTGWILDDDGADNKLALYLSRPLLIEGNAGAREAVFEVSLSRPAPEALTLAYRSTDDTATAGEDYQAVSGTLNFQAGQTRAAIRISINGDETIEADETFFLSFDLGEEFAGGARSEAFPITIENDDLQSPPQTVDDNYFVLAGRSLAVDGDGVLANDSDPEGDSIEAQLVANPSRGTLALESDGRFSYTPNSGFTGTDSFVYRAFDGIDTSRDTTVTISVRPQPRGSEPEPTGPARQVNSFDEGDQITPSLTALSNGSFAAAWVSRGQDGDGDGIYGQIVDASGNRIGAEFRLNATIAGDQQAPRLASLENGDFVAVWDSFGQDGDADAIIARRFGADGAALGEEVMVNQTTASWQVAPDVIGLQGGGYAVVWQSDDQDGDFAGVYGRVFGADDTPTTDEFQLNQEAAGYQGFPRIDQLADGRLIAVWDSEARDGDGDAVIARLFSTAGLPAGDEFQINNYVPSYQSRPDVAALAGGGFAFAWQSYGQDGDRFGVYTRAFDADGLALGNETRVARTTRDDQEEASVAAVADGSYFVSYEDAGISWNARQGFLMRFSESGAADSQPTALATSPRAASLSDGQLAFQGDEQGLFLVDQSGDISATGIVVQLEESGLPDSRVALAGRAAEAPAATASPQGAGDEALPTLLSTAAEGDGDCNKKSIRQFIEETHGNGQPDIDALDHVLKAREALKVHLSSLTDEGFEEFLPTVGRKSTLISLQIAENFYKFTVEVENRSGGEKPDFGILVRSANEVLYDFVFEETSKTIIKDAIKAGIESSFDNLFFQSTQVADSLRDMARNGRLSEVFNQSSGDLDDLFKKPLREVFAEVAENPRKLVHWPSLVVEGVESGGVYLIETFLPDSDAAQYLQAASDIADAPFDIAEQLIGRLILGGYNRLWRPFTGQDPLAEESIREAINESYAQSDNFVLRVFADGDRGGCVKGSGGSGIDAQKGPAGESARSAKAQFEGAQRPTDPIVFDLDGDGLELISVDQSTARFDLDADGFAETTGWVAADDAFLVYDRNGDGVVNDISEFFGSGTVDGYAELEGFDSNRDGVIAADEPVWSELQLWRDLDGDGNTDDGELFTLESQGITGISVEITEVNYRIAGNFVPYLSTFEGASGAGLTGAAFFQLDQFDSSFDGASTFAEDFSLDPETLLLPFLRGYGNVPDLYVEMSLNATLKDLVVEFTELETADYGRLRELGEEIVYRWARVEEVPADSRGPFVDGRKLAALETFFGEPYEVSTRGGRFLSNDPNTALRGRQLESSWDLLFDGFLTNLLVQSNFAEAFDAVIYDLATDGPLLVGSIFELVSDLAEATPTDAFAAIDYWSLLGPIVQELGGQSDLSAAQLVDYIDQALLEAGLPFSLTTLNNVRIASGRDGARYSGTQGDDLFVGSEANENFFGSQGSDTYFISTIDAGDDRIVEVTSRLDEEETDTIVLPEAVGRDDFHIEATSRGFVLTLIDSGATVTVEDASINGGDGDFGVEIIRLADGTELLVADLLGAFAVEAGDGELVAPGADFERKISLSRDSSTQGLELGFKATWSDGVEQSGRIAGDESSFTLLRSLDEVAARLSLLIEVSGPEGLLDSDQIVVNVQEQNSAPGLQGDAFTIAEDTALEVRVADLLINDNDPDGDALTVIGVQAANSGRAVLGPEALTFTPDPNFHGAASFEYLVSDGSSVVSQIVAVTVSPVNDNPSAGADVRSTAEDRPVTFSDLLANDSDVETPGRLRILSVDDTDSQGSAVLNADGSVTYDPDGQFDFLDEGVAALDSFSYRLADADGGLSTATVTVRVTGVNDASAFSVIDPTPQNGLRDAFVRFDDGRQIDSDEFALYRTYGGALGRVPDLGGFLWWDNQIETGNRDVELMTRGFVWSPEFLSFFPGARRPDDISNEDFITHMYENIFGRSPDAGGFAFWVGELESGRRDKANVVLSMTSSDEYVQLTSAGVVDFFENNDLI